MTPMKAHWRRLGMTLRGEWRTEYQIGRKSELKRLEDYKALAWLRQWGVREDLPEITHASWNVAVEQLRQWGVWNRKDRDPSKDLGYRFPE